MLKAEKPKAFRLAGSAWTAAAFMMLALSTSVAAEAGSKTGEGAQAAGEAHHGLSADEVAKKLANPNNDLARLTFKNQYRFYEGELPDADEQDNYTLLFQPIFPFSLGPAPFTFGSEGGNATFFARPAFPFVVNQPYPTIENGEFDWDEKTALGDIGFDLMYGVTEKSGFLWAGGMVGTLPTATDSAVAGKALKLGPEGLLAYISKPGVVGVFPSHQWDVTGWNDDPFNTTQIQPLLILTPGDGWQIASKPIMTYDWENEEWTVPINLSVAKTFVLGSTPLQIELEANYYVDNPDAFGPGWMIGLNFTPVVSNFISNLIRGR